MTKLLEYFLTHFPYFIHRITNSQIYPGLVYSEYRKIRRNFAKKEGIAKFDNKFIHFTDGNGFLSNVKELYKEEPYFFESDNNSPRIIDGGAYIGLSILYFKKIYPKASITAFEADPNTFEVLQKNLEQLNLSNVEIINKALWDKESTLTFYGTNAMAGSLLFNVNQTGTAIEVPTVSLKKWLNESVDFLKLDIEGAEYAVLNDIKDELVNVKRIFIEYHSSFDETQRLDEILAILRTAGFRYYITEANNYAKKPFLGLKKDSFDLQLNIFGMR
jgi:FkbM family methyltransferase